MSKYLITGAAGFIGSHLVEHLIADGVKYTDIRLLVAPWDKLDNLPPLPFEIVAADIRNINVLQAVCRNVDIVYHLASKTGHDGGSFEYYKDTILEGTKNLIKLSLKHKVKKFIFFSSTGVYGLPATAGDMSGVDESVIPQPTEGYGKAKLMAENEVIKSHKKGLKYLIIRPVTVFGTRDRGGLSLLIKAIRSKYFFYIGPGNNQVSYIYVKDLVEIARELEKNNRWNNKFIAAPSYPLSTKYIVSTISNAYHVPTPNVHIPIPIVLTGSYLFKFICELIGKQPIIFPNRVKVFVSDFYFNVNRLNKLLPHYEFTPFNEAMLEISTRSS